MGANMNTIREKITTSTIANVFFIGFLYIFNKVMKPP